jgi:hypothetical protein
MTKEPSLQGSVEAGFIQNAQGEIAIFFDDPGFVRAEAIVYDPADKTLHAILFENSHFLGTISEEMAVNLLTRQEVLLYARPGSGGIIDLPAPVRVTTRH